MSVSTYTASSAAHATKIVVVPVNTTNSVPFSSALGLYAAASTANGIGAQPTSTEENHRYQSGRYWSLTAVFFTAAFRHSAGAIQFKDSNR